MAKKRKETPPTVTPDRLLEMMRRELTGDDPEPRTEAERLELERFRTERRHTGALYDIPYD